MKQRYFITKLVTAASAFLFSFACVAEQTNSIETPLDINDSSVFSLIKEQFVFADRADIPSIPYKSKFDFGLQSIEFSAKLDDRHLILIVSSYKKPSKLITLDISNGEKSEAELPEIFANYVTDFYGISANKDYLLFGRGGYGYESGIYQLLAYDLKNATVYNIEDFMADKDYIYHKTGQLLHKDGREYAFLPDLIQRYGQFSFNQDNGFSIAQSVIDFNQDNNDEYYASVQFPSLQTMIANGKGTLQPQISMEKISDKEAEKRLYFINYYSSLPLIKQNNKLYNVPRSNVGASFGLTDTIKDEAAPYLFIPFHYYLNPQTLTPYFASEKHGQYSAISSVSNDEQVRYTGLLVNDKDSYQLKKVLVHGIGSLNTYQRHGDFVITADYSDLKGANYLVVWDLKTLQPIAKLIMEKSSDYSKAIYFDEPNQQIIAVQTDSPDRVFIWDYYPKR